MGVDKGSGTDTRTEHTDAPANRDHSPGVPPDNPGSPGQPSRLDSRGRAGQQGNGSQPAEGTTGSGRPEGRRDARTGFSEGGSTGKAESGKAETGQAGQQDQESRSRDGGARSGGTASGGRDRPQGQPAEPQTDGRAEPADRSASPARQYRMPADNPGSPGQPSRLESRARAREAQQSRAEGVQDTGSGGGAAGRREDPPGSSQAAGRAEKPGTPTRIESGQGGRRDEQPRSRDNGAQTGGGTSVRDRPPGQAAGRETDTHTEPADRPASSARQYTLPADNPGSPGQPSRLESRARAREAQEQRKAQDVQYTGGQNAGMGGTDSATIEQDAREPLRDKYGPSIGVGEREDEGGHESAGTDTAAGGGSGGASSGDRDRPTSHPSEEAAGGGAPEAGSPPDREHGPLSRQDVSEPADGPTSPGVEQDPRRADEPGRIGEHPPRPTEQTGGPQETGTETAPGAPAPRRHDAEPGPQLPDGPAADDRTPRPESAEAPVKQPANQPQDGPAGEQTTAPDQGSEQPLTAEERPRAEQDGTRPGPKSGQPTEAGGDATAVRRQDAASGQGSENQDAHTSDRRTTDSAPAPSQGAGEAPRTHDASGEGASDHGRKAEDDGAERSPNETNEMNPEVTEPGDESTPPSRDSGRSGEGEGPRRDLAPHEENPVETEPSRFGGQLRMSVDSDGRPVLPNRDPVEPEVGTRGRGEFGSPESDPADRDPRQEDSERLSRRRELRRGIFDQPDNVKDSVDTFADPIRTSFDRVQPTGHHTGVHNNMDQFKSPDHPLQAGNIVLTAAGATIIILEGTRRGAKIVRQLMRRVHDNYR